MSVYSYADEDFFSASKFLGIRSGWIDRKLSEEAWQVRRGGYQIIHRSDSQWSRIPSFQRDSPSGKFLKEMKKNTPLDVVLILTLLSKRT